MAHGTMKKHIGQRVRWSFLFAGLDLQMIRDCQQSEERRFEYFRLHDPAKDGAQVGHMTRRHTSDGIHWRGVVNGQDVRARRSPSACEREGCEVFTVDYASAVSKPRDDEPNEATVRIENSPAATAAADFANQVMASPEGRQRPAAARAIALHFPAAITGAMLSNPDIAYALDPLDPVQAIDALGTQPLEQHVAPDLPFSAVDLF